MTAPSGDTSVTQNPGAPAPAGPGRTPPTVFEKAERAVARAEAAVMTVLVIGLILLSIVHVFAFIKYHLIKNPELETEYFRPLFAQGVFAIGFLGTAIATQENKLFRVDFVVTFLAPRWRLLWRTVGSLFSVGAMIALIELGRRCLPSLPPGPVQVTPFMRDVLTSFTDWISGSAAQGEPFLSTVQTFHLMLWMFALCTLHFVLRFLADLTYLVRRTVPDDVLDPAPAEAKRAEDAVQ